MTESAFEKYLELRQRFAVSRDLAVETLAWAEPLARQALGAYARRDMMGLGEELPLLPVLTSPADNGGWGELMPVWFKPYERPVPVFILDNWAAPALLWGAWLGSPGPAFNVGNLLKIFVGSGILIPFLPRAEGGGHFLRHGALTVLLGLLWLPPADREPLLSALQAGAGRFAGRHQLRERRDLADYMGRLEAEAFLIAEGAKVGGEEAIRAFLADGERFPAYADLFGGLCFSLAALHEWYGSNWEDWVFQAVNVHYRYAHFGLEAWARWLGLGAAGPGEERA